MKEFFTPIVTIEMDMRYMFPEGGRTMYLQAIVSIYTVLEHKNQILKTFDIMGHRKCLWI
jgi:hypothetical protein